jgi:hypothetical protein
MDWFIANLEWIFSGIGLTAAGLFFKFMKPRENLAVPQNTQSPTITITNSNSFNQESSSAQKPEQRPKQLQDYKNETHILFIDDDPRFRVTKILAKSGWVHTKLIKDAGTLEIREINDADILFIDVQGVGVAMGFSDEGLGLALAIKKKHPSKKVIIYSAETQGDRFHEALRNADNFLPKNADPYEFQKIVEEYTIGNRAS